MFPKRRPSLRYYAVLRRALSGRRGSVWEVQDRRNPLRQQYLFVPSRMNSWPIWLKRLESLDPTPTRLRNGKVALLFTSSDVPSIRACLRRRAEGSNLVLNAMTGFQPSPTKRKNLHSVWIPTIAAACFLVLLLPKDVSSAKQTLERPLVQPRTDTCKIDLPAGSEISGSLARYKTVVIRGQKYKIAAINDLGGLAQVKAKRICDNRYFRFDAWLYKQSSRIERVY